MKEFFFQFWSQISIFKGANLSSVPSPHALPVFGLKVLRSESFKPQNVRNKFSNCTKISLQSQLESSLFLADSQFKNSNVGRKQLEIISDARSKKTTTLGQNRKALSTKVFCTGSWCCLPAILFKWSKGASINHVATKGGEVFIKCLLKTITLCSK